MVNHNSAASFGSHFARCGNLCRQGIDVREDKAGQLVSLKGFFFRNSIFFMNSVIAEESQAVRPFLQVLREFSSLRERVDAGGQILVRMLRCQVLGRQFERSAIHRASRVPLLTTKGAVRLQERTSDVVGTVRRDVCRSTLRDDADDSYPHRVRLDQYVAAQLMRCVLVLRFQQSHYGKMAVVAHEVCMKACLRVRKLRLAGEGEAVLRIAVGTVMYEGGCHA